MIEFYNAFKEMIKEFDIPGGIGKINEHVYSKKKTIT